MPEPRRITQESVSIPVMVWHDLTRLTHRLRDRKVRLDLIPKHSGSVSGEQRKENRRIRRQIRDEIKDLQRQISDWALTHVAPDMKKIDKALENPREV